MSKLQRASQAPNTLFKNTHSKTKNLVSKPILVLVNASLGHAGLPLPSLTLTASTLQRNPWNRLRLKPGQDQAPAIPGPNTLSWFCPNPKNCHPPLLSHQFPVS